jgi:hypothetical protein
MDEDGPAYHRAAQPEADAALNDGETLSLPLILTENPEGS